MPVPAPVIAVAKEIALAIVASEGVKAWDKLRGNPSAQDLHRQTVEELRQVITEEVYRLRVGQALSHHANADREVGYYRNNPVGRRASLGVGRVESGYAMSELESVGGRSLHQWLIAAELHMTVLQEEYKLSGNAGDLQSMKSHVDYMAAHIKRWGDIVVAAFQLPPPSIGTISLSIPDDPAIMEASSALGSCNSVLASLRQAVA